MESRPAALPASCVAARCQSHMDRARSVSEQGHVEDRLPRRGTRVPSAAALVSFAVCKSLMLECADTVCRVHGSVPWDRHGVLSTSCRG